MALYTKGKRVKLSWVFVRLAGNQLVKLKIQNYQHFYVGRLHPLRNVRRTQTLRWCFFHRVWYRDLKARLQIWQITVTKWFLSRSQDSPSRKFGFGAVPRWRDHLGTETPEVKGNILYTWSNKQRPVPKRRVELCFWLSFPWWCVRSLLFLPV